jgi:DNA-binding helix-hairpin-helix protein with protein kinase domain
MNIYDKQGAARLLGAKLAAGGEGTVYPLADNANVLVKIYHPDVLQKRGVELLAKKTQAMLSITNDIPAQFSWPKLSVLNEKGMWIGYAMRRAEGVPMQALAHAKLYQKYFPSLDRLQIVRYLISYLESLQKLHQKNIFVGDFNLRNVICNPGTNQVTFIDCDSYQLEHDGHFFPCPVLSADMTPPEHHLLASNKVRRTAKSESFSAAIVLFKALMLGRHPYDAKGGGDPVKNIQNGNFPYGLGNKGIPPGPWYNIWSHMPHQLKRIFIQNFSEGAKNPAIRPNVQDWLDALRIYEREIHKGWHEVAICPEKPKEKNYRGTRSVEQINSTPV